MVKISTDTNKKLIKICENGFPNEVCGVLVGKITGDNYDRYDILDFAACKNLNTERAVDRYELDPSCLLYTSPSPRDLSTSRMPSSA